MVDMIRSLKYSEARKLYFPEDRVIHLIVTDTQFDNTHMFYST